jgi:Cytochrome c oxidase subunit IV
MKVEAKILIGLGLFFGTMCAVYWRWSVEDAGGVMMFAGMLLCFLPGSYYYWWSRRMKARPEDDPHSTQAQGAGVIGSFPGTSIWPLTMAAGCFFLVLALVFGIWLIVPALALVVWALLGGTAEGRRGGKV